MKLNIKRTYDNWLVLLTDLANGTLKPTYTERTQIADAAQDWPSCACGQLCSILPRTTEGAPKDQTLYSLGLDFYNEVEDGDYYAALRSFKAIEAHSTKLVKEQQEAEANAAKEAKVAKAFKAIKSTPNMKPAARFYGTLPYNYNSRY